MPPFNRKFDFFIPVEAYNGRENARDYQGPNNNPSIAHSNSVTAQAMRFTKQSTRVVDNNRDSDSNNNDEDIEFINVDLPCNMFSVQLLANDSIIRINKKDRITDDKDDEPSKSKANQEKKKLVKRVGKKSTKASIPISSLIGQPPLDIQALLMNTNIVILALHLF